MDFTSKGLAAGCSEEAADGGDDNKEQQELVRVLSNDVLADVFRRLAPRWLAASRCVCRDWLAAIDARRLLRADRLPLSFRGIFVHFNCHKFPEFFARPSPSSTTISGRLDFLPSSDTSIKVSHHRYYHDFDDYNIQDHCNGLLLLSGYVVNPATRRWDPLPPCPATSEPHMVDTTYSRYLVFNPAVSPHYEVFMVPKMCSSDTTDDYDPLVDAPRWSRACLLRVFTSRSGGWEERSFVRRGGLVTGPVRRLQSLNIRQCAVYWREALYVQRKANFVVRLSLSDNTYRVISPPAGMGQSRHPTRHLAKSEKGVYYAALDDYRLRVWILDGQMEWMLKSDKDLQPLMAHQQVHRSWVLKDVNYNLFCSHLPEYRNKNEAQHKFEWNSDGDDDLDDSKAKLHSPFEGNLESVNNNSHTLCLPQATFFYDPDVRILGFHPYKEVVFLSQAVKRPFGESSLEKGLAYHLSTSKVQSLGNISPTNHKHFKCYPRFSIKYSFTYTPCWLQEFPTNGSP
ncbi:unnamed protein product [Alopecurus aequalis]